MAQGHSMDMVRFLPHAASTCDDIPRYVSPPEQSWTLTTLARGIANAISRYDCAATHATRPGVAPVRLLSERDGVRTSSGEPGPDARAP